MPERKRRTSLSEGEFVAKYGRAIRKGRASDLILTIARTRGVTTVKGDPLTTPVDWHQFDFLSIGDLVATGVGHVPWFELHDSWIAGLLRKTASAKEPEEFKALLVDS